MEQETSSVITILATLQFLMGLAMGLAISKLNTDVIWQGREILVKWNPNVSRAIIINLVVALLAALVEWEGLPAIMIGNILLLLAYAKFVKPRLIKKLAARAVVAPAATSV